MRVRAYATLRDLLGKREIDLPLRAPTDVGYVLRTLVADCPPLGKKLWDGEGRPTGYVKVLLNGRSIEYLSGMETPVADDDVVALFPPVGGG